MTGFENAKHLCILHRDLTAGKKHLNVISFVCFQNAALRKAIAAIRT